MVDVFAKTIKGGEKYLGLYKGEINKAGISEFNKAGILKWVDGQTKLPDKRKSLKEGDDYVKSDMCIRRFYNEKKIS